MKNAIDTIQKEITDYISNKKTIEGNIATEKATLEDLRTQEAACFDEANFYELRAQIRAVEDKIAFLQKLAVKPTVTQDHINENVKALKAEQDKAVNAAIEEANKHADAITTLIKSLETKLEKIQDVSNAQKAAFKTAAGVEPAIFYEPTGKLELYLSFVSKYSNEE